jgi:hypothetical protein
MELSISQQAAEELARTKARKLGHELGAFAHQPSEGGLYYRYADCPRCGLDAHYQPYHPVRPSATIGGPAVKYACRDR